MHKTFGLMLLLSGLMLASISALCAESKADASANALFETITDEWLARSPMLQASLGLKTDNDKWDNISEAFELETHKLEQNQLKRLAKVDKRKLSTETALNHRLLQYQLEQSIESFQWRYHNYPVSQMSGWHTRVPAFLINSHPVTSLTDAEDYIARLSAVETLFDDLIVGLTVRAKKGIIPPKFVFQKVIEGCENVLKGAPFESGEASVLLKDFSKKVASLNLSQKQSQALLSAANLAMMTKVKPAYARLISSLKEIELSADAREGVWKLPEGEAFYTAELKRITTTDLSAEQIHNLGLREVERIQGEMKGIMKVVGFKGDLRHFFTFMKTSDQFYFPNTEGGKAAYLSRVDEIVQVMEGRLDELFISKPKAELVVKPVEAYREKSAGSAFYRSPPADGSRPGVYSVNLYNMRNRPIYKMESLAYHETLPGHHLQISIARELGNVPRFRKLSRYIAYIEGWGLYSEQIPKDIGLYQDPYSDFGRLEMELWRACRLVVDTGLHAKRWSYDKALAYLNDNTPSNEANNRKAIERYIVMPAQATAYKIGMIKILELREAMKHKLKDKFDIREFHEKVLRLGSVPLDVLEDELLGTVR